MVNELLHGGFTYLFMKFLKKFFSAWLISLPVMTSACILKDTLRNDTQVFLKFRNPIFEICLHLINSNFTPYFLTSSPLSDDAGTSKEIPPDESELSLPAIPITFWFKLLPFSCFDKEDLFSLKFKISKTASNLSHNSIDSDVFYVEQSSNDSSLPRPNTRIVFNSTEMSGDDTREMISISSIASPEPWVVTIDSDSNEPTKPYGFGRQLPIISPNLNDLNLPPNPFNILATRAVVNLAEDGYDENYSPQSPESSEPSPISTPAMNISTIDGWETPHTTTDANTFYSDDEPRRIFICCQLLPHRRHPERWKKYWALKSPSQKERECRSTSARLVNNCSLSWRTYQARRQQTINSRLKNFI